MKCTECSQNLIWGADHDYEAYGMEGNGIVTNCTCPNEECEVELILIYKSLDYRTADTI